MEHFLNILSTYLFIYLLHALKSYLTILIIILHIANLHVMQSNFCCLNLFCKINTSFFFFFLPPRILFKLDLIKKRIDFELTSMKLRLKATNHPKRDATSCPGIFFRPIPSPGWKAIKQNLPFHPHLPLSRPGTHRWGRGGRRRAAEPTRPESGTSWRGRTRARGRLSRSGAGWQGEKGQVRWGGRREWGVGREGGGWNFDFYGREKKRSWKKGRKGGVMVQNQNHCLLNVHNQLIRWRWAAVPLIGSHWWSILASACSWNSFLSLINAICFCFF